MCGLSGRGDTIQHIIAGNIVLIMGSHVPIKLDGKAVDKKQGID